MNPRAMLRLLMLVLCLFGTTLQGVSQVHQHARPFVAAAERGAPDVAAPGTQDPACLLCEVAGHSSGFAPPPAAFVASVEQATLVSLEATDFVAFISRPAHHWRGRGPPLV
ncbi:hypothetical protein EON77_01965 [bacterium]|nr:MAG: hypothetical protein EON77_01965 [bacterium]